MRWLLAAALTVLSGSSLSAENWALWDKDCRDPLLFISEEDGLIESGDFVCEIKDKHTAKDSWTYTAECQTDLPSIETMQVKITPQSDGRAIIDWSTVNDASYKDSELYKLCPMADSQGVM